MILRHLRKALPGFCSVHLIGLCFLFAGHPCKQSACAHPLLQWGGHYCPHFILHGTFLTLKRDPEVRECLGVCMQHVQHRVQTGQHLDSWTGKSPEKKVRSSRMTHLNLACQRCVQQHEFKTTGFTFANLFKPRSGDTSFVQVSAEGPVWMENTYKSYLCYPWNTLNLKNCVCNLNQATLYKTLYGLSGKIIVYLCPTTISFALTEDLLVDINFPIFPHKGNLEIKPRLSFPSLHLSTFLWIDCGLVFKN